MFVKIKWSNTYQSKWSQWSSHQIWDDIIIIEASVRWGRTWFSGSTHQLLQGTERYYDSYSFHLRIIQLKRLQTLESSTMHLGVKEFRQPCTKHDRVTCALFSLVPEAVKWSQRPRDTIISGGFRSIAQSMLLSSALPTTPLPEGHVTRAGTGESGAAVS